MLAFIPFERSGSIVPARNHFNGNIMTRYRKLQRAGRRARPLSFSLVCTLILNRSYCLRRAPLLRGALEHRNNNDGDNDDVHVCRNNGASRGLSAPNPSARIPSRCLCRSLRSESFGVSSSFRVLARRRRRRDGGRARRRVSSSFSFVLFSPLLPVVDETPLYSPADTKSGSHKYRRP